MTKNISEHLHTVIIIEDTRIYEHAIALANLARLTFS